MVRTDLEVANGSANGPASVSRRGKSLEYGFYTIGLVAVFVFFWVFQSGTMLNNVTAEDSVKKEGKIGRWQGKTLNNVTAEDTIDEEGNEDNVTAEDTVDEEGNEDSVDKEGKVGSSAKQANMICSLVCSQRRHKRSQEVDLLNSTVLVQQVSEAKDRLISKLKIDYGDYFEPIFVDSESGRYRPFQPSQDVSMERLKRKLKIKILSMQMELGNQDSDFHGCDCSQGRDQSIREIEVLQQLDTEDEAIIFEGMEDEPTFYGKYTWATGGHSASAGHGNLYNESYTAYMESNMKDVFGSIGFDFEGRNYAMGGTSSATVISMCWKEVFGTDVDFFSWDYGMTDGKDTSKIFHYAYRGALSETRPAFMVIHNDGRSAGSRLKPLQSLEQNGLPLFRMVADQLKAMKDTFPDSAGISEDEIKALPEYVRNYRCGTGIEKGDPYCRTEKYTDWGCTPRSKQTSWHPGFKDNALVGHALSLFLVDVLLDVLGELRIQIGNKSDVLEALIKEDVALHEEFTRGPLPEEYKKVVNLQNIQEGLKDLNGVSFNETLFSRGPSMCHTARLPAQIRYNGILTDDKMVGGPVPVGQETYYVGHDIDQAHKIGIEDNNMRLVYSKGQREIKCTNDTVKPDYPDSWYVNSLDGWASLKFPNRAEQEFYNYDKDQYQGVIVFHIKKCDWGNCPSNFLQIENYNQDWEMKVNGQQVIKVIDLGSQSGMAVTEGGFRFDYDEDGQYEIEIKVNTEKKYLEFADFVIY